MIIRPISSAVPTYPSPLFPLRRGGLQSNLLGSPRSPTHRIVQNSPSSLSRSSSEYMIHLVPQHVQTNNFTSQQPISLPHNSSVINLVHDNKSNRSNSLYKSGMDALNIKMESTATKSINLSESSHQKSQLLQAHKQAYFCPPSPVHLRKIEPVRRIAQQNYQVSPRSEEKSNNKSQQDIRITIESSIPKDSNQLPPKITVSHIQHSSIKKQSISVFQQPSVIERNIVATPSPLFQQKQIINGPLLQRQPSFSNKFQIISIASKEQPKQHLNIAYDQQIYDRKHSLSMDSRQMRRPMTYNSNQTSSSGFNNQSNIVVHQPSKIQRQQPVSFNANQQESKLRKASIQQESEADFIKESQVRSQKKSKSSLQSPKLQKKTNNRQKLKAQVKRMPYNEVYDEYYHQEQEEAQSSLKRQANPKYAYLYTQRISNNSQILINEIFENETNKVLLKMRSFQRRSRQKSLKRSKF